MTDRHSTFLARALIALPLVSLALGGIAWLRYGIDIPWSDDWRGYHEGTIDSLAPGYLFRPMNGTMSPLGLALDALAQRFLGGNSVAYQFLSMVAVLGTLLLLQWKLLNRALDNKLHAAICFTFTLLMLQPGSYWGLDNLAYHQSLPLIFILGALLLMSGPVENNAWRGPAVALLGALAGFSYISGAFGALAAGVALLGVAGLCLTGRPRRRLLGEAGWFTAASAVAAGLQFYFSVLKGQVAEEGIPVALPTEPQFWAYALGKLGRSLLLPMGSWTSALLTMVACAIALACVAALLRRASSAAGTAQEKQVASILIPLAAVVAVYLMIIAAARTHFRPPEVQGLRDIFAFGFLRFHFFWAALIWPWVVGALFVVYRPWFSRSGPLWAASLAVLLAVLMFLGGGFSHMAKAREIGESRTTVANCLLQELQKGGAVQCDWLLPPRPGEVPDSFPAYLYARKIGASFVRHFPLLPGKRRDTLAAFYRMDGTATPRTRELVALGKGLFRAVGADPQLFIQTNQPQIMRRCMMLDVELEMKSATRDTVELFFVPTGDSEEYSAQHSVASAVGPESAGMQTISFRLSSESGFFESLRLDPVTRPQVVEIREIRLYCVWEMPQTHVVPAGPNRSALAATGARTHTVAGSRI